MDKHNPHFSHNPAELEPLPPIQAVPRYVEAMGGANAENGCLEYKHAPDLSRREFLGVSAAVATLSMLGLPQSAAAQPAAAWNQGQLAHLIPTATHERFLLKASFRSPLTNRPHLTVDGRAIAGVQTDLQGRFWRFDATGLQPATQYELRIVAPDGAPLCDAWPLKTFPAPDAAPERVRSRLYVCRRLRQ
jgi:hypothetical protein